MSVGSADALGRLSPLARASLAALVAALLVALLAFAPHAHNPAPVTGASDAEREVVTLDVDPADEPVLLAARLAAVRTTMSAKATPRAARTSLPSTGRAVTAPASALPVLRVGDHGPAIAFLQKRLGVKVTGVYGPLTYAAVVAFQKRQGLPARGIVGPATWRALVKPRAAAPAPRARNAAASPAARVSAPVTAGRVCPAPGASFGDGWLVPRSGHLHQGQDLMGRIGMPLLAIEDAVVIREGRQSNGALRIVLQGVSGSKFYYGHMSRDLVHAGTRVARGQVIGLMGDSGSPGAVHLHFEYWKSGGESAAVNPTPLLRSLCG
jgi:murein DD-endopeptidase MepM/ murein hydrolase activator NlpD